MAAGWIGTFIGAAVMMLGVAWVVGAAWFFGVVALFLVLAVTAVAGGVFMRAYRRLDRITEIAELMATGDLTQRIDDDAADRIGVLARSVDRLADTAAHDARRWRNAEQLLWHDSRHDPMTGLPNRRRAVELFEDLRSASRVGVVFVEVEGLSSLNDRYGRRVGDEAVLAIAGQLTATAAGSHVVSRWGGTEFVIVLTGPDVDEVDRIIGRIEAALDAAVETSIGQCRLAVGAGGVVARRPRDASALVAMAEQAMRRRRRGPSTVELARIRAAASN